MVDAGRMQKREKGVKEYAPSGNVLVGYKTHGQQGKGGLSAAVLMPSVSI